MTFHMVPHIISPYSSNSRFHVKTKQNNRRTRRIRITPVPATRGLLFSLGSMVIHDFNIEDNLRSISECILAVFNKYFTSLDPLSLSNQLAPNYTDEDILPYLETFARYNRRVRRSEQRGGKTTKRVKNYRFKRRIIPLTTASSLRAAPSKGGSNKAATIFPMEGRRSRVYSTTRKRQAVRIQTPGSHRSTRSHHRKDSGCLAARMQ